MGFPEVHARWTGRGVKVAVVDTGVTTAHPDVHPAGGLNTLDGEDPKAWFNDLDGHGTHCAGVIAGLPTAPAGSPAATGVIGGAPAAEIHSVRVFPGGFLSDLVEAVEWCILNHVDVVSLSLGMPDPSEMLGAALRDAHNAGLTCVAATGNDRTTVAFPAAYPTVLGIGAIGQLGTFPQDSAHVTKVSRYLNPATGVFAAEFSNFGPEVDLCAPGVAVLSSVPGGYAAWDGTSMACPMISALAALLLEAYPRLRTGNAQQPEAIRSFLQNASVDLGLPPFMQGRGMPMATRALAG